MTDPILKHEKLALAVTEIYENGTTQPLVEHYESILKERETLRELLTEALETAQLNPLMPSLVSRIRQQLSRTALS